MSTSFRFHNSRPVAYGECCICGANTLEVFPKHNSAIHDVYFFEKHGMSSVTYPNRPFVEGWSNGTIPLP